MKTRILQKPVIITIIIFQIVLNISAPAQNKRMQFKGKILDKESRVAIKGENVTISGTKRGTKHLYRQKL